jgi:hypothetical protein
VSAEPFVFLAALADGRTCLGSDRDGEARLTLTLSRNDAAKLMERMDEFTSGFYCTLVAEHLVTAKTPAKRKRRGQTDDE